MPPRFAGRSRTSTPVPPLDQPFRSAFAKKCFRRAEEETDRVLVSPSAPSSRAPPLASNFNYTLPIGLCMRRGARGRGRWGEGRGEASKRGLERREWLDARPTYQDNGFHRSRCSVYTNPWQGVALDFHCIALSLAGVESAHTYTPSARARARARRICGRRPTFDRYFCVTTSTASTCPAFPLARERTGSLSLFPAPH